MKKEFILVVLAGLLIFPAFSQNPPQDKNWEVVFQDDFNTFNTTRWWKEYGPDNPGGGKDEGVGFRTYDNVFTANGNLVMRTKKENNNCTSAGNCRYPNRIHPYSSGDIVSRAAYHYGYYEMYAKLPSNKGFSPGFWFWNAKNNQNECWYNEINVIEVHVCKSNLYPIGIHAHFPSDCSTLYSKGEYYDVECTYGDGYHWYGLEWNKDRVTWYLDRKIVKQLSNNFEIYGVQHPMYMIIGVGLRDVEIPGYCAIPSNTTFPKDMLVDQLNAYKLKCDKNTVVNEIPNYNTFNYAVKKSITLSGISSLSSGQNVSLRASDFIELKEGFEVPLGAELYLDNNPCE